MTFTMYDSTDASQIPSDAQAVAYYADSQWANLAACLRQAPHAKVLPILPAAGVIPPLKQLVGWQRGVEIDVENTDWTPASSPTFVKACLDADVPARIYCSLSVVGEVVAANTAAGIARSKYMIRSANWDGVSHIDAGVEATQWTDKFGGLNCDASLCQDNYFASRPAPAPRPSTGTIYGAWRFNFDRDAFHIWNTPAPHGVKRPSWHAGTEDGFVTVTLRINKRTGQISDPHMN